MALYEVDINCDMGESFGKYVLGYDEDVLKYISSANIACGFHAGDAMVMGKTVELALKNGVNIGAHPGYPDLQGFGRRSMKLSFEELKNMALYQIGALDAFARAKGTRVTHVKLHGALGNDAHAQAKAGNFEIVEAVGQAVLEYDRNMVLVGFARSEMIERWRAMGLKVAEEVFADRAYNADGTLVSRKLPGSVITSPEQVVERVIRMVKERTIISIDNKKIEDINIDTICVHGDTPTALELVKKIREAFKQEGIEVRPFKA